MSYIRKHGIGDYFTSLFEILPKVLMPGLPLAAALFLPVGLLYGFAFSNIFSIFNNLQELGYGAGSGQDAVWEKLGPVFVGYGWLIAAGLLYALVMVFMDALMTRRSLALIQDQPEFADGLIKRSLRDGLTVLRQSLLMGCVYFTVMVILGGGYGALIGFQAATQAAAGNAGDVNAFLPLILLGSLILTLVLSGFSYWLMTKTVLAVPVVVAEQSGALVGLGRSFSLVKGYSWRVFGTVFLIGLVLSFALSILTGPIFFVFALPAMLQFFQDLNLGGYDASQFAQMYGQFLSGLSWAFAAMMWIEGAALALIQPIFLSLLYANQRVRQGEWVAAAEAAALPPVDTVDTVAPESPAPGADQDE